MNGSERKSEQVYRWLLAYIDENKFSGNQKLPSENALCRRLNVSRETVRVAMDQLGQEGLIYRVKGSGTYFYKDQAISRELSQENAKWKIGLILQGQDPDANAVLINGIRSVLVDQQVDLHMFLTDNKFSNERRCLQTVMHQNFQGFIVDGVKASIMNPNLDCYKELYRRRIPVIFYNNYYKNLRYPRVIVNDMECADQLVGRLLEAGHKRIAGIFIYDNYQSVEKFQGMATTMRKYGVEMKDHYIKWCISDEAHSPGYVRSIEKFLRGLPKCTAVVCCNYMIYRQVCQAIEKMGKTIPEDYSVVCFDYSSEDPALEGVTCSITPSYEMGRELGLRLMRMIAHKDCDDRGYSHVMMPQIYEGRSIGPVSIRPKTNEVLPL